MSELSSVAVLNHSHKHDRQARRGACIRLGALYRGDKPIATSGHCLDAAALRTVLIEHATKRLP
jgi:hypothetical protein